MRYLFIILFFLANCASNSVNTDRVPEQCYYRVDCNNAIYRELYLQDKLSFDVYDMSPSPLDYFIEDDTIKLYKYPKSGYVIYGDSLVTFDEHTDDYAVFYKMECPKDRPGAEFRLKNKGKRCEVCDSLHHRRMWRAFEKHCE